MPDDISNRTPPTEAATAPLSIANMPASASPVAASALEAARERTIRLLTDRFADDSLDLEQFEALLDRMYKATTAAELDVLLRDVDARTARRAPVAPAYGELPAPRRVLSIMSNTERSGRWSMPRQLEVRALMSSIVLDLRETTIPAGVCEIDLLAVMASVEILVPPGVVVEDLALGVMANVENRAIDEGIVPADAPRIRITGTAVMSNVEVRMGPVGLSFRAAWREARKAWRRRRRGEW